VKPREPAGTAVVAYGLTRDDHHRVVTGIPVLKQAVPVREATHVVRHHDRETDVRLIGTTSEYGSAHAIRIERGRFLTDRDVRTSENVAFIGHGVAQRLFPGEDPIGKSMRIGDTYFLVVGTRARAPARSARADRRRPDLEVYVPLSTMGSRLGDLTVTAKSGSIVLERFELSRIEITLDDPAEADEVAEAIRRLLKPFHEQPDYSVEVVR
jgi:putative ABC transport system permease protein